MKKSLRLYTIFFIFLTVSGIVQAQNTQVDLEDSGGGLLIPRMTAINRGLILNPAKGLMVYDLTFHDVFLYDGNEWKRYMSYNIADPSGKPGFWGPTWSVFGNINAHLSSLPPLIGNTDNYPLSFITYNIERMRIFEKGNIAITKSLDVNDSLVVKRNTDLNTDFGQTTINGPFTIANMSPGLMTGKLTVDKKTLLKEGLEVYGSTTQHGYFTIADNYPSLLTGSVFITDITQSFPGIMASGALAVSGGVGIGKNLNIGGNFDVKGSATFGGPVSFSKPVTITALNESNSTTDGALIVYGGVGIGRKFNVGGSSLLDSTLSVRGRTNIENKLDVINSVSFKNTLDVTGVSALENSLVVNGVSTLSNQLSVLGVTKLNSTLNVTGPTSFGNTLTVTGATTLSNNLSVLGASTLSSSLSVGGDFTINSPKFSIFSATGNTNIAGSLTVDLATNLQNTLAVSLDTKFNSSMEVDGLATFNDSLTVTGATELKKNVVINANPPGGQSIFDGYPLRIKGASQGIAIDVSGSRSNANNFMSFWDGNGAMMRGRIEGQQVSELTNDYEYNRIKDKLDRERVTAIFQVTSASVLFAIQVALGIASYSSITGCFGFANCITAPLPSMIAAATAGVAAAALNVVAAGIGVDAAVERSNNFDSYKATNIGVTYLSKAGDYAEWIPKMNQSEDFIPGMVIALKNGKITMNTSKADKILVVSTNPIILGNMPDESEQSNYVKVAFLGQVPVHVMGKVNVGDYILPSGFNDGLAIAKSPTKMTTDDYSYMVGMAWSESKNERYSLINVGIGLNNNDISKVVSSQNNEIDELREEIEELEKQNSARNDLLAKLIPEFNDQLSQYQKAGRSQAPNIIYKDSDNIVDEIIQLGDENPSAIIYFESNREHIRDGVEMADKMIQFLDKNHQSDLPWNSIKLDTAYKESFISDMLLQIEKSKEKQKALDREQAVKIRKIEKQ